jgi:phage-related protein
MVSNVFSIAKNIPSKIKSAIQGAISTVTSWGSDMLSKAKTAVTNVVNGIVNTFKTVVDKVKSIGGNIVEGVWNGIGNKVEWIKNKISQFKDAVLKKLKEVFGIKSPSRLMKAEIGTHLATGVAEGMTESDAPKDAVSKMKDDIINTANRDINGITIKRQIESTFSGTVSTEAGLLTKLDYIIKCLEAGKQIVLDTGVLVGETVDVFDSALMDRKAQKLRGW